MLKRDEWLDLARKLDWDYSYIQEQDVFPPIMSEEPWLPHAEWKDWDEPYRTTYSEYVKTQFQKGAWCNMAAFGEMRQLINVRPSFGNRSKQCWQENPSWHRQWSKSLVQIILNEKPRNRLSNKLLNRLNKFDSDYVEDIGIKDGCSKARFN